MNDGVSGYFDNSEQRIGLNQPLVNSAQNDIHAAAEMICLIVEEMFEAELYKKRSQSQHENTKQDTAAMLAKRALTPYTAYQRVSYPARINNKDEVLETTGAALDQVIRKIFTENRLLNRAAEKDKDFQRFINRPPLTPVTRRSAPRSTLRNNTSARQPRQANEVLLNHAQGNQQMKQKLDAIGEVTHSFVQQLR
jgi:hypothetical protein